MAKVLSIEIGSAAIHMCEVDYKAKNPRVYKHVTIRTPEGMLKDDVIETDESFVSTIKEALAANKIHVKQIVFTMGSTKIASREVTIPYVKENRIADVIRSNASDYFPVDLDQYELAHSVVGVTENDKGVRQYKLQVLAAPKTIINSYQALAAALGGTVIALDYSGNSLYQMVHAHCDTGVKLVAKIDENSTLVTVLKDQAIVLQRNVSYGVMDAVAVMMNAAALNTPSYEEAVRILCEKNCMQTDFLIQDDQEDGVINLDINLADGEIPATLQEEVGASLNYLISGISRVVDYYNSRNGDAPIEKIYLTGIGGDFQGLDQLLYGAVDIRVTPLKESDGFRLEKDFKADSFGPYITCIGAAIKPLGFIGEKNEKKKLEVVPDKGEMKRVSILVLTGGILIAAALAAVSLLRFQSLTDKNKQLQQRIQELEPIKTVYAAYLQQKYTFDKITYFYNSTVVANENLVAFIEEMEVKMPKTLNVISMTSSTENVNLSVTVQDKKEVAMVIRQFRTFESIDGDGIVISGLNDTGAVMNGQTLETEGQVSFSITLPYKWAGIWQQQAVQEQPAGDSPTETQQTETEEGL